MELRESTHPYWTIADAERSDLTHLEIRCVCGRIAQIPWRLLPPWPRDVAVSGLAGRLVCTQCGARPRAEQMRAMNTRDGAPERERLHGRAIR